MNSAHDVLVASLTRRIETARRIADELRHDEKLHRLAMDTVFALEDATIVAYEAFRVKEVGTSAS